MTTARWLVIAAIAACGGGSGGDADAPPGTADAPPGTPDAPPGTGWWRPMPDTSWQWQLQDTIDTTVEAAVFDIDLFDTPQGVIDDLHAQGRKVICYFDTAYEPGRPDSAQLDPYRGNPIDGWPGQFWLDFREQAVRDVMTARLELAATKHCDGVEPDDVDAIDNDPGFPLTPADQLDFCTFLATGAHDRVLAVGLKNNLGQVPDLVSLFDYAINEECFRYNECGDLAPFITAGKPVWQTEYTAGTLQTKADAICPMSLPLNFDTIIKHLDLDAPRAACR